MPIGVYKHKPHSEETKRKIRETKSRVLKGKCCGEKNNHWKGGIIVSNGYVRVLQPNHPRAIGKYVKRCYLVWESLYGFLPKEFELHHTNGNRLDDRIENLSAMTKDYHHRVECVLCGLDFVVVAGIYPNLEDTWKYIESLKARRENEELADFIFTLQMNPKLANDFGKFVDSDVKQFLSHIVPALRDSLP